LFNGEKINRDEFFVDLAITNGVKEKGKSNLWRKCCLESFLQVMRMADFRGSQCEELWYTWCHTKDVGAVSSAPKKRSAARAAGLVYFQAYWTGKQMFDANKMYTNLETAQNNR
jgi:hypothetical protein